MIVFINTKSNSSFNFFPFTKIINPSRFCCYRLEIFTSITKRIIFFWLLHSCLTINPAGEGIIIPSSVLAALPVFLIKDTNQDDDNYRAIFSKFYSLLLYYTTTPKTLKQGRCREQAFRWDVLIGTFPIIAQP